MGLKGELEKDSKATRLISTSLSPSRSMSIKAHEFYRVFNNNTNDINRTANDLRQADLAFSVRHLFSLTTQGRVMLSTHIQSG